MPITFPKGSSSQFGGTSVRSYGAVGDGVTDDTAAIAAASAAHEHLFFPPGTYRVTALPQFANGTTWQGSSPRDSIIKLNCVGPAVTQTSDAAQVYLHNLSIVGETYAATFLKQSSAAMHYMTYANVNFENLRAGHDFGGHISYWFHANGVRVKDCLYGFVSSGPSDEMTFRLACQNNQGAIYELVYTNLAGGSFAVGNTVTGGTSTEATTVLGVIPTSGTAGSLIVWHAKGENGSPLTLGYTAAETLSNGSGVTATYASKLSARAVKFDGALTGCTFIGCDMNVTGIELHGATGVIIGGYMESYTFDIPVLTLDDCNMFLWSTPVAGSVTDIDDDTYRQSTGWAPSSIARALAAARLFDASGSNQFPDPTIQNNRSVEVWGGTISKSQAGNVLTLAGADSTVGKAATFSLPVGSQYISALVDIEGVSGTPRIQFNNVDGTTANYDLAVGERMVYRATSAATAGAAPQLRIKGVSGAYEVKIRLINVCAVNGYIAQPETSMRTSPLVALTENAGAIGGTNNGDLPSLAGTPSTADLVAAIRELATRVNELTR